MIIAKSVDKTFIWVLKVVLRPLHLNVREEDSNEQNTYLSWF